MHLDGYLYEDYHDARSLEHKVHSEDLDIEKMIILKWIKFY